jgi:hypothetical protein
MNERRWFQMIVRVTEPAVGSQTARRRGDSNSSNQQRGEQRQTGGETYRLHTYLVREQTRARFLHDVIGERPSDWASDHLDLPRRFHPFFVQVSKARPWASVRSRDARPRRAGQYAHSTRQAWLVVRQASIRLSIEASGNETLDTTVVASDPSAGASSSRSGEESITWVSLLHR